jgi:hypothetical protein
MIPVQPCPSLCNLAHIPFHWLCLLAVLGQHRRHCCAHILIINIPWTPETDIEYRPEKHGICDYRVQNKHYLLICKVMPVRQSQPGRFGICFHLMKFSSFISLDFFFFFLKRGQKPCPNLLIKKKYFDNMVRNKYNTKRDYSPAWFNPNASHPWLPTNVLPFYFF